VERPAAVAGGEHSPGHRSNCGSPRQRTLARPEYREMTPIISRDVIGAENVQGD